MARCAAMTTTMTTTTIISMNICTGRDEARALGSALSPTELLKLQAWFSPAFPVGAFGYSHGLAWAVESGDVRSARSLRDWVEGVLRSGAARSDPNGMCAIWGSVSSRECR